jgi:hypothetical protein
MKYPLSVAFLYWAINSSNPSHPREGCFFCSSSDRLPANGFGVHEGVKVPATVANVFPDPHVWHVHGSGASPRVQRCRCGRQQDGGFGGGQQFGAGGPLGDFFHRLPPTFEFFPIFGRWKEFYDSGFPPAVVRGKKFLKFLEVRG